VEQYRKQDPLARFRHEVVEKGLLAPVELDTIDATVKREIVDAVQFAKDSPAPDPATAMDYIYA
jgi:pyruvate dehydrogenase E1 component alpha subunit